MQAKPPFTIGCTVSMANDTASTYPTRDMGTEREKARKLKEN
jgi:hypothetical protein